jgi:tRNA-specific 2-thiouridylase
VVREKIGIAMSGGVDSSVSASLLVEQGYAVHGFFMRLPVRGSHEHLCRARQVAACLSIPLVAIDVAEQFNRRVIKYFVNSYMRGQTPNPCVICNREVKFGALMEEMRARGMDKMATGHYARLCPGLTGSVTLARGKDPAKDQSYFLARLSSFQLSRTLFPLGGLSKKEVYERAESLGLRGVHAPESQDVCFLSGQNLVRFFAAQGFRDSPGDITTAGGEVLGRHKGIWRYTVGQRRGLGLPDASPWYVMKLDASTNRVVVGKNEELLSRTTRLREVDWHGTTPAAPWRGTVQIRGRHRCVPAVLRPVGKSAAWLLEFEHQQRAVTPGQFAVFYEGQVVRGSGIIDESRKSGLETAGV